MNKSNCPEEQRTDLSTTLREYIMGIAEEVLRSYEMDVCLSELTSARQALVIKSVSDDKFFRFLRLLKPEECASDFVFLCEESDTLFFRQLGIPEENLIFHNGRISRSDVRKIPERIINSIEKVCFCNYSDFKPNHANVEELGIELMKSNEKLIMYSFNVAKQTLNKYISAQKHLEGTKLLDSFFKWESEK